MTIGISETVQAKKLVCFVQISMFMKSTLVFENGTLQEEGM
jgi:hypothetical protein